MTKNQELRWRLKEAPTFSDVERAIELKIITKEEARDLLFSNQNQNDKVKDLEKEVDFLKGVVEELSKNRNWTTVYKYVEKYPHRPYWWDNVVLCLADATTNTMTLAASDSGTITNTSGVNFTNLTTNSTN